MGKKLQCIDILKEIWSKSKTKNCISNERSISDNIGIQQRFAQTPNYLVFPFMPIYHDYIYT